MKWIQNPGGHKEDWASFPDQSQYMNSKIHSPNPTLEKRKGGREEEKGRAPEERPVRACSPSQGKRERERERERERVGREGDIYPPLTLD